MVLDEGYDVFFLSNPSGDAGDYKFSNEELLRKVLAFTKERLDRDHEDSLRTARDYKYPNGMKNFPLNKALLEELEADFASSSPDDYTDVLLVSPQRSQMRSVLIFATRKVQSERRNTDGREGAAQQADAADRPSAGR